MRGVVTLQGRSQSGRAGNAGGINADKQGHCIPADPLMRVVHVHIPERVAAGWQGQGRVNSISCARTGLSIEIGRLGRPSHVPSACELEYQALRCCPGRTCFGNEINCMAGALGEIANCNTVIFARHASAKSRRGRNQRVGPGLR